MAFTYEHYRSPYVGTIMDMMLHQNDPQARAAEISGQAWGGAVSNIGQMIGSIPGQIAQGRRQGVVDQSNQLKLSEAQTTAHDEQLFRAALSKMEAAHGDPSAAEKFLIDAGPAGAKALAEFRGVQRAQQDQHDEKVGELGYRVAQGGNTLEALQQELQNDHSLTPKLATMLLQQAQSDPSKIPALSRGLMAQSPKMRPLLDKVTFGKPGDVGFGFDNQQIPGMNVPQLHNVAPGGSLIETGGGTPGPGPAPPTPQPASAMPPGQGQGEILTPSPPPPGAVPPPGQSPSGARVLFSAPSLPSTAGNEAAIRALYAKRAAGQPLTPAETAAIKGFEAEKSFNDAPVTVKTMVNGRPVERVMTRAEALATGQFTSQPPASVTIHNMNATAPNMPTWALDESRPTGPDRNTLDPTIRMTPNGLYQAAQNYIVNGQFPPTGRGSDPVAIAQRSAITSKVGAIAAASGMDEPSLRAFFKANASSLNEQQKMYDAVQGFMATADKNAALLQDTLKKLPDVGSPLFNKPLRAFEKDVAGDTNLSQFATYLRSVQNEYGRIVSQPKLAGQLTDSARHEAEALIDPKATVPQIIASIQALSSEGTNRLVSVAEQIQRIQQRMQTPPPATPPAASGGLVTMRAPNGQTKQVPAAEVEHYKALGAVVVK